MNSSEMDAPRLPVFLELTTHHGFQLLQQAHGNIYQWYEIVGKGSVQFQRSQDRADKDQIVKIFGPAPRRFKLSTVLLHFGEQSSGADEEFLVVAVRLAADGIGALDGLESEIYLMDWGNG